MRRIVRRVIVISALLTITAIPAGASASDSGSLEPPFTLGPVIPITDQPSKEVGEEERLEQIAVQYAKDEGVGEQEALRRLKVQHASNGLTEEAKALLGDQYAGVWFDRKTGDVRVGITSEDQRGAVDDLLAKHVAASDGSAVLVDDSRADLQAVVAALRPELAKRSPAVPWIALDDVHNRVVIGLSESASANDRAWAQDAQREFAAGRQAPDVPVFPATAVEASRVDGERVRAVDVVIETVPASEIPRPKACVRPHCGTPLRSGVGIKDPNYSGSYCSVGFYGRWYNWAQSRFEMYVMTAGHCMHGAASPIQAYHQPFGSWQTVGPVHTWRFGNRFGTNPPGGWVTSDIGLFRVQESPSLSWWYTTENAKLVMWGWPSSGWDWWSISNQDIAAPGRYGCRTGITTNYTCGSVQYQSISTYYANPGTTVDNLFTVPTACTNPGDSGGAFVDGGTALGMVSGGPPGCETYFAHVWDVGAGLGVWVATTPPRR